MIEPPDAPPAPDPVPAHPLRARARLALALVAVAVLVAAFLVLRGGGSGDDAPTAASPQAPAQADGTTTGSATTPGTATPAEPLTKPAVPVIRLRGGSPVGGVRHLTVTKGRRIRFDVVSDAPGEVHLHGYDVERELTPGRRARFDLPATLEGRFEVELHGTDAQVARLDVTP
jgi:hypothetical protein